MDARLAPCRFYLARAPTSSHKSTLPSPVYSPSSNFSFPPTPRFLPIRQLTASIRHFLSLGIHASAILPAVSNFLLPWTNNTIARYPSAFPIILFNTFPFGVKGTSQSCLLPLPTSRFRMTFLLILFYLPASQL